MKTNFKQFFNPDYSEVLDYRTNQPEEIEAREENVVWGGFCTLALVSLALLIMCILK